MKNVQVYDKPICCSTGVCGPQVDPVLPRFAADLDLRKSHGNQVERFDGWPHELIFTHIF